MYCLKIKYPLIVRKNRHCRAIFAYLDLLAVILDIFHEFHKCRLNRRLL